MRICVTGGSGFVGRNFIRFFLKRGYEVACVDPAEPPAEFSDHNGFQWYHESLRDYILSGEVPDQFDLIMHCAAIIGGRSKIDGDPMAVAENVAIDSDFFRWVVRDKRTPSTRCLVIYFSSSAVYPVELQGERVHCALSEGLVDLKTARFGLPDQTYGWAKLTGEYLAQIAWHMHKVPVKIYRPFSGYGEDQALDYPFPALMKKVAQREESIVIWGTGDQERDFIHIDDIVHIVMGTYQDLPPCEPLNLGTGVATSFKRLVRLAVNRIPPQGFGKKKVFYKPMIGYDEHRPQGVWHRVCDPYKLEELRMRPTIKLHDGIARMLDHFGKM